MYVEMVSRIPVPTTIQRPSRGVLRAFPEGDVPLLEAFLRELRATSTRKVYRRVLRDFTAFLGRAPESTSRREIARYREHLEVELCRSPATVVQHLAAISGYLQFSLDEGVITTNPAKRVKRPRLQEPPPKAGVTPGEVRRLLSVCDPETSIGLRDRALILVLAVQALRISEALGICVHDLSAEGEVRVAQISEKGGGTARIPLAPPVARAIDGWIESAAIANGPVFVPVPKGRDPQQGDAISQQGVWRRLQQLRQRAGIDRPLHPHLFRHGAATAALDNGVPLHRVQDHLRHADPRTTRRYDAHRLSLANPAGPVLADLIIRGSGDVT